MSRCGLRKLYFGCKKVIFLSYFTVNRTKFSAQLACARWLLQMLVCCLADFHLFLAKTDYSLPLATLFSNFSTAKKLHSKERKQKPFAAQTPPRKRGYGRISPNETHFAPPKAQKLSFYTVHIAVLRNRRATSARIWGSVRSQTDSAQVLFFIYSNSQQDKLFCPACLREMTLLNFSFMFPLVQMCFTFQSYPLFWISTACFGTLFIS